MKNQHPRETLGYILCVSITTAKSYILGTRQLGCAQRIKFQIFTITFLYAWMFFILSYLSYFNTQ